MVDTTFQIKNLELQRVISLSDDSTHACECPSGDFKKSERFFGLKAPKARPVLFVFQDILWW